MNAGKKVGYSVVDGVQLLAERLARGSVLLNRRELVEVENKSKRNYCVTFWEMGAMALQIASHRVEGGLDAKEDAVASVLQREMRREERGGGGRYALNG